MTINPTVINAIQTYHDVNKQIKTMTYVNECVVTDIFNRVTNYYTGSALLLFKEDFILKVGEYLTTKEKNLKPNLILLTKQIEDIFFLGDAKVKLKGITFLGLSAWGYQVTFTVDKLKTIFALKIPFMDNMNLRTFISEDFGKMTSLYCLSDTSSVINWQSLECSYDTQILGDSILQFIKKKTSEEALNG